MTTKPLKVLIGGGSGHLGTALSRELQKNGHQVTLISRKSTSSNVITWKQLLEDPLSLPENDVIVQLAGQGIMDKRWNTQVKKEIFESRVGTSKILWNAVNKASKVKKSPSVIVSGSAVGYYPQTDVKNPPVMSENILDHDNSFAGELCLAWEDTLNELSDDLKIRKVISRTPIVLGPKDQGAMKQMLPAFKFGGGAVFGTGDQYFPWIHIDDMTNFFMFAIQNPSLKGAVNATAPQLITNAEFTKVFASVLNRPAWFTLPESILKIIIGEGAPMLTKGAKVSPDKLKDLGFTWKYPDIESALKDILQK